MEVDTDLAVDTATPITHIDPELATKLSALCEQYRQLSDDKGAIDAAQKVLMEDIKKLAARTGSDKVRGNGWLLLNVESGRSDIDATKLLAAGVPIEVVTGATVRRTWRSWQVRGSKDNERSI